MSARSRPLYQPSDANAGLPVLDDTQFRSGIEGVYEVMPPSRVRLATVRCWQSVRAHGDDALVEIPARNVPVQRPIGMPDQGPGLLADVTHPALSVTRLRDAICVPGGIVVRNDIVFTQSFSAPWDAGQHRHMSPEGGLWAIDADRHVADGHAAEIEQPVLYLDHQHIAWFGHVIADLLSPAWAYEYMRTFLGLAELHVLCTRPRFAFVGDLIVAAGVSADRILYIDRPVLCRTLLLATKSFQIQEYVSPPAFRLWRGIAGRIGPASRHSLRIYVSRGANPTRPLVEEREIERLFAARGFLIVHPEAINIREQIALFSGAHLIAGCSGSNMFNLAFASNVRAVMIMVSPLLVHYSEQFLATANAVKCLDVVIGYTSDHETTQCPGNVHAPWHLTPSLVEQRIEAWIGEYG